MIFGSYEANNPLARFIRDLVGWGVPIVPMERNLTCFAPGFQPTEKCRARNTEHLRGLLYRVNLFVVG